MLVLCKVHNKPENVNVSLALRKILLEGKFAKEEMVKVVVFRMRNGIAGSRCNYYLINGEIPGLTVPGHDGTFLLYDRDKERKENNDRIMVLEIKRNVVQVCDECFKRLSDFLG